MAKNDQYPKQLWDKDVEKTMDRFPERKAPFVTSSDIPIDRLYTPDKEANKYIQRVQKLGGAVQANG